MMIGWGEKRDDRMINSISLKTKQFFLVKVLV